MNFYDFDEFLTFLIYYYFAINNIILLFVLENLKENIEHLENQNLALKLNVETKDKMNSKVDFLNKIYKLIMYYL